MLIGSTGWASFENVCLFQMDGDDTKTQDVNATDGHAGDTSGDGLKTLVKSVLAADIPKSTDGTPASEPVVK